MAIIGTPTYVIQKDLIKLIIPSNEVAIFQSDNQKKIKYHLETFEMISRIIELVLCGECNILKNKKMFFAIFFAILSVTNSMKLTPRIHAAEEAYPNQFPYVVSLRLMKTFDGGRIDYNHFSGGGILNERWIISSAHQFHDEYRNSSNVFAFVGAHHFWRDGDKYGVRRIIIHPEFDWLWKTHDISLLKTSSLIIFADYVQPLPISTEFIDPGHEGVFAGWGETEVLLKILNILKQVF